MFPPNFIRFHCTVLENGIETFPHTICLVDDLYRVCTFFNGARMKRLLHEN